MGAEPSQQPPDWWNISGPCCRLSLSISSSAASVASTLRIIGTVSFVQSIPRRRLDPTALLQPVENRPADGGPAGAHAPARQHVGRIVHAEIDAGHAHKNGDGNGDAEEE